MSEIRKIFKTVFILIFIFSAQAESKILSIGSPDAKITVKVFSSLTCPHCANFHTSIFNKLKKEYIDEGLVRFEHHAFPLDLAALNAEVVIRCQTDNEKKEIIDKINSFFGYNCIGNIKLKITQDKIKLNEKIFPKIKNLSKIEEKMSKVNDSSLKSSLNNFLKAFNERNK